MAEKVMVIERPGSRMQVIGKTLNLWFSQGSAEYKALEDYIGKSTWVDTQEIPLSKGRSYYAYDGEKYIYTDEPDPKKMAIPGSSAKEQVNLWFKARPQTAIVISDDSFEHRQLTLKAVWGKPKIANAANVNEMSKIDD